jgi:hypothetical protein
MPGGISVVARICSYETGFAARSWAKDAEQPGGHVVEPVFAPIRMYGKVRPEPSLSWEEVSARLADSPIYWLVSTRQDGAPHARPVHGIYADGRLLLSNGSWNHHHNLVANLHLTVHLESGTVVVIVEGRSGGYDQDGLSAFLDVYNPKYGLHFEDMLPPFVVMPETILAWDTIGPKGVGGFRAVGKWIINATTE